jgi:ectoine hydroxylase-related dioxygenase (phytanoyl-CoA dioxygenase family)
MLTKFTKTTRISLRTYSKYLTNEDKVEFEKKGYTLKTNFFTPEEKKNIIKWTNDIQSWPEVRGKWMTFFEDNHGKRMLCRVENYVPYNKELSDLFLGKITDACSFLMGGEMILYKDKLNFKLAGGKGYTPHQDAPAFSHFAKKLQVSVMIAVDPANDQSGCLEFVPGCNKQVYPHTNGVLNDDVVKKWDDAKSWVPIHAQSGDIMFFDSLAPHRSGPNLSDKPRRNYYLTYNYASEGDLRAAYWIDKRKNFPPDIEREDGKDYSEGGKIYNVANPITTKTIKSKD